MFYNFSINWPLNVNYFFHFKPKHHACLFKLQRLQRVTWRYSLLKKLNWYLTVNWQKISTSQHWEIEAWTLSSHVEKSTYETWRNGSHYVCKIWVPVLLHERLQGEVRFHSCLNLAIDRSDWWKMTTPAALPPIWTQCWQREGTHSTARMKYASSSCSQSVYRRHWFRPFSRNLHKMYYLHCGTEGRSSQMAKLLSPREHVDLFCCTDIITESYILSVRADGGSRMFKETLVTGCKWYQIQTFFVQHYYGEVMCMR